MMTTKPLTILLLSYHNGTEAFWRDELSLQPTDTICHWQGNPEPWEDLSDMHPDAVILDGYFAQNQPQRLPIHLAASQIRKAVTVPVFWLSPKFSLRQRSGSQRLIENIYCANMNTEILKIINHHLETARTPVETTALGMVA